MPSLLVFATSLLIVLVDAEFSSSTQQFIVDLHNSFRSKLATGTYSINGTLKPAGSNIRKMSWDSTLATSAQTYANTCPTGFSNTQGTGENLYWRTTSANISGLDIYGGAASVSWEQEFQKYGWATNYFSQELFDTGVGNGTQMAWAKTNLVGCGVKNCGKDSTGLNKVAVVCHYKPLGRYVDQMIYTAGFTCSQCPTGTSCDQTTGLCA
ncbi:SCP domain-containing protein [Caenorhabditis elegans]|uniref:SCP domain-containing protein n=1 Tax=Caenorhabditis elegans TaxID=6239 RepID=Q18538_CAEEL|nr:SCP domain-containing protein [Caenorhabditis elegans]CAA94330.1 SCP domain-containing protein [Caenorhabditis elegans]|eukprot:NP_502508.1 SCP-Like extracellular protein [Caenorhabditis elegans]